MSTGFKFISDSSHGWLAVDLKQHPKAWNFGTGYGYIDEKTSIIYLEEDYEASQFIKATFGDDVSQVQEIPQQIINGQAFVRGLPHNEAVYSG